MKYRKLLRLVLQRIADNSNEYIEWQITQKIASPRNRISLSNTLTRKTNKAFQKRSTLLQRKAWYCEELRGSKTFKNKDLKYAIREH